MKEWAGPFCRCARECAFADQPCLLLMRSRLGTGWRSLMTRVLEGIRIVELAGLAPAPFAAMMLADHGAEVIRIERAGEMPPIPPDKEILRRGRAEILALNLKDEEGAARVRALAAEADGLIEGFRPGVMERLGLGPEALLGANP